MKEYYIHGERGLFIACIRIETSEELGPAVFCWSLIRAGWTVSGADVEEWNSMAAAGTQTMETGADYKAEVRAVRFPRKSPAAKTDLSNL